MCVLPALRWPPCTPASLPSPAHILGLRPRGGQRPRRRHHAETSGFGYLDSCTCILAKDARVGRVSTGSPFSDGLLPLAFLTLTLAPVWDGESAPPRPLPSMAAQPEPARVQCGTARSGLLEHPARVFIYYSVTFFLNFTLIMIIQEYYLSDKFRVSFLIYNFLLC